MLCIGIDHLLALGLHKVTKRFQKEKKTHGFPRQPFLEHAISYLSPRGVMCVI